MLLASALSAVSLAARIGHRPTPTEVTMLQAALPATLPFALRAALPATLPFALPVTLPFALG